MVDKADAGGSPERFGFEWNHYHALDPAYEEQFRRWLPFFQPADWVGKRFLDVGCGMGRNSYWPMRYGASSGVAVDVDDRSLRAARQTLECFPAVEVAKCSAYDLSYISEFDIVFSIGVVHHLEWPEMALARMTDAAKPDGVVAIWVYGKENNRLLVAILNPLRKMLFSRLPISWVHGLSIVPAAGLWLLLRLGFGGIAYFNLIRSFNFRHLRSIVFDQMLPRIAYYWDRDEVAALMVSAGLEDIRLDWVNEISWAAYGRKPSTPHPSS